MRKKRSVKLTDLVWAEAAERALLENTSISALCEYVLTHYVALPAAEKPPIHIKVVPAAAKLRSIHTTTPLWAEAKKCKVYERRPVSAILEQQLRGYLGLEMPADAG